MPRVSVKEILLHATAHRYGVPAINVFDFESIKWAVEAAEQEKLPIIIQYYPGFAAHMASEYVAHIAKDMAAKASVPVAVHLDHSASFEIAVSGIRDGFPSVMVDGSSLPFEENVALTKSVVDVARVFGVDMEAELGHVGVGASVDDIVNTDHYTSVEQAAEFVRRTGCDSLAIAVGNAHGVYVQKPSLDFDRIKAIRAELSIPLVMHGSSDIPDDQIQQAVNLGMSKFNIATEYDRAFYQAAKALINPEEKKGSFYFMVEKASAEPIRDFVVSKLRLLNPNGFSLHV